MVFVGTLLGMVGAFTLAWAYLIIRRYQLARLDVERDEAARIERLMSARTAEVAR
jgi:hypothetical protein